MDIFLQKHYDDCAKISNIQKNNWLENFRKHRHALLISKHAHQLIMPIKISDDELVQRCRVLTC